LHNICFVQTVGIAMKNAFGVTENISASANDSLMLHESVDN